jgi:hypothetical protein
MRAVLAMVLICASAPALGQGFSLPGGLQNIPGLGVQQGTPEQKRAFCQRAAGAAARCATSGGLSLDMVGLTSCLVRTLPPQDSLRVAQVANSARGNAGSLLSECGIGLR